jgi:hypothetical protein
MKGTTFRWFFGFVIMLMAGCTDPHLGMNYQRCAIGKINNDSIYCYRFGWGTDGMAYYITKKKDPCLGLNVEQDICLGKGESIIYFKVIGDTLNLYTNTQTAIPKNFPGIIAMKYFDNESYHQLEEPCKRHAIRKVSFDTVAFEAP